jgi:catechol 2,3-dioxygenase-like lactoylglutathione lyase family enzyme
MVPVHHTGLCPADLDASLRFYVEGIGLEVLFDVVIDADLAPLLGEHTQKVRTVFLGSRANSEAGALELLDLGTGRIANHDAAAGAPQRGLFLVSFNLPVAPALERLAALGLGGQPRRMSTPTGGLAATVIDPDGVMVELLDQSLSFDRPDRAAVDPASG